VDEELKKFFKILFHLVTLLLDFLVLKFLWLSYICLRLKTVKCLLGLEVHS